MHGATRRWLLAAAIAGSLDLASAFVFSGFAGVGPDKVLAFVASGPFGDAMLTGGPGVLLLGLAVHYSLMAIMAGALAIASSRWAWVVRRPWLTGVAYGFMLWIVMYWIVRPLRWPAMPLPHTPRAIAEELFSHIALVGIPIAMIVSGAVFAPAREVTESE